MLSWLKNLKDAPKFKDVFDTKLIDLSETFDQRNLVLINRMNYFIT